MERFTAKQRKDVYSRVDTHKDVARKIIGAIGVVDELRLSEEEQALLITSLAKYILDKSRIRVPEVSEAFILRLFPLLGLPADRKLKSEGLDQAAVKLLKKEETFSIESLNLKGSRYSPYSIRNYANQLSILWREAQENMDCFSERLEAKKEWLNSLVKERSTN